MKKTVLTVEIYWRKIKFMYLLRVLLFVNELGSFFIDASLMAATFKTSKKLENVTSDVGFLEECIARGVVPKGLTWKLQVQGLDQETEEKVERIKQDATSRVMDVMMKGLKRKKEHLEGRLEEKVEEGVRNTH